jgi:ketosteroid isomerase-like protein
MAEHPDVALVRRGYAAFSTGDMATLSELLAEDARQYQPGSASISGEYRGRDAILAFYGRLASETNGTFRVVLEGVYTDGEGRVVASSQTTAERGDRRLDTGAALVFTIKDGKAQDVRGFQEDLDVWNDFWS